MKLKGKVGAHYRRGDRHWQGDLPRLAKEGAAVAINYSKSETDAASTASELQALGAKSVIVKADVASDKAVREMVRQAHRQLGRLDILVNNAGLTRFIDHANLEAMEESIWDRILAVNLKGLFFCCRAVASIDEGARQRKNHQHCIRRRDDRRRQFHRLLCLQGGRDFCNKIAGPRPGSGSERECHRAWINRHALAGWS